MTTTRTTPQWQEADSKHFLHPFTDHRSLAAKGARVVERGQGVYVWDTDGNKILDAMSGLWCVNVGYGQQALIDAATEQLRTLPFYNAFFNTATPPAIELAELLSEVAPEGFRHVFFSSSGSESNDTNVRLVRRYWDLMGQPQRRVIIGRHNGYHGSTMAGASLSGMSAMHAQGGLPIPDIVHVEQPHWYELGRGMTPEAFGLEAARSLEAKILELGADKVAAFIGEPVQGAGGVIIPPPGYWKKVEAICRKYGILLVSDEVICGFGRLGEWFGFQHFGISPDIVSMAKGLSSGYLPISATGVSSDIVEVLRASGDDFVHGYTYSGHPVAAAVALRNIQIIEDEHLVDRTRKDTGLYLARALAERLAPHPLVGEARSLGLIGAVEIVAEKGTNRRHEPGGQAGPVVRDECIRRGLMVRAIRDSIVMSPPLVITHAEIDQLVDTIAAALDAGAEKLGML